jgi:antitoxin component YwqK of YwqJK toxin-antitoxin module
MKFIVILFFLFCSVQIVHSQGKYTGDKGEIELATKVKKFPLMNVWDRNGNKSELNTFIKNNELHPGKPYLLVALAMTTNLGIAAMDKIAASDIPDNYNVVVFFMGDLSAMTSQGLSSQGYENKWGRFVTMKTTVKDADAFMFTAYPSVFYADRSRNVLFAATSILSVEYAKPVLESIHKRKAIAGKTWFTQKNELINADHANAYYYVSYTVKAGRTTVIKGTKKQILETKTYLPVNGVYYLDGLAESKAEDGKLTFTGKFKSGIPVATVKAWHPNQKLKYIIPVNGIAKYFDDFGNLSREITMVGGLANGIAYTYEHSEKTEENMYRNGELHGLQKEFLNGKLYREYYSSPEFALHSYLVEGLQFVGIGNKYGYVDRSGKMVIPAIYSAAGDFYKGFARVRRDSNFYIGTTGKPVPFSEARETRRKWKADASVPADKKEIMAFLQSQFVSNIQDFELMKIESVDPELTVGFFGIISSVKYKDIIGFELNKEYQDDYYTITVLAKVTGQSENVRSKLKFRMKESVNFTLASQIIQHLRKLTLLEGGKIIQDEYNHLTETETLNALNRILRNTKGVEVAKDILVVQAELAADKYSETWEHQGSRQRNSKFITGINWEDFQEAYATTKPFQKGGLVKLTIDFQHLEQLRMKDENGKVHSRTNFDIWVQEPLLVETLALIYHLHELYN